MNKLSNNLKNLLLKAKISENELARRTGISQQIINRMLSGENKNPKIATLSPLANYFMVSISELIGDESFIQNKNDFFVHDKKWMAIPFINLELIKTLSLEEIITQNPKTLILDFYESKKLFAGKLFDTSMEPKFSEGTLLIFDMDKKPENGDFVLINLDDNSIIFRQIIKIKSLDYKKALNANHDDFKINLVPKNAKYLGTLIQSRTTYINH